MDRILIEDKIFKKISSLNKGEYDNCAFLNCDFSETSLSNFVFSECEFDGCNLSNTKLNNTGLKDVKFSDCKLLGLNFDACNVFLLSLAFNECQLNFSSFYKLKLKGTIFKDCSLEEVDFIETELSGSVFDNCDLNRATFENTILKKVNFRTSYNYSIDPEINSIDKAKFSLPAVIGLLDNYNIDIA